MFYMKKDTLGWKDTPFSVNSLKKTIALTPIFDYSLASNLAYLEPHHHHPAGKFLMGAKLLNGSPWMRKKVAHLMNLVFAV